jgi:hypothetical protein
MGEYVHNWRCWKLRLWQDVFGKSNPKRSKRAMGRHSVNGILTSGTRQIPNSINSGC